ncbi:hypothetical protein TBLA_0G00940 [Henningerozyma blattae CBS 6284]|uniref:Uncharacterized protein n=1 Tax=Henningerozyma blattae (strain ATCC 34711 / CBS 6284 / DSM 70876 / NBRC 10599 / NRRL Y-10934 / UCD 77-7) TaxID=1071380 RepID=I2H6N9_HENB6|nr:hypothetical protein TBLA_0G00940 [Tetrapisispora blattae CBS 6284]CCH62041.1 hypothetical protein TBLA_0G00940 [Tetrapisispora blattae CBS 6284]
MPIPATQTYSIVDDNDIEYNLWTWYLNNIEEKTFHEFNEIENKEKYSKLKKLIDKKLFTVTNINTKKVKNIIFLTLPKTKNFQTRDSYFYLQKYLELIFSVQQLYITKLQNNTSTTPSCNYCLIMDPILNFQNTTFKESYDSILSHIKSQKNKIKRNRELSTKNSNSSLLIRSLKNKSHYNSMTNCHSATMLNYSFYSNSNSRTTNYTNNNSSSKKSFSIVYQPNANANANINASLDEELNKIAISTPSSQSIRSENLKRHGYSNDDDDDDNESEGDVDSIVIDFPRRFTRSTLLSSTSSNNQNNYTNTSSKSLLNVNSPPLSEINSINSFEYFDSENDSMSPLTRTDLKDRTISEVPLIGKKDNQLKVNEELIKTTFKAFSKESISITTSSSSASSSSLNSGSISTSQSSITHYQPIIREFTADTGSRRNSHSSTSSFVRATNDNETFLTNTFVSSHNNSGSSIINNKFNNNMNSSRNSSTTTSSSQLLNISRQHATTSFEGNIIRYGSRSTEEVSLDGNIYNQTYYSDSNVDSVSSSSSLYLSKFKTAASNTSSNFDQENRRMNLNCIILKKIGNTNGDFFTAIKEYNELYSKWLIFDSTFQTEKSQLVSFDKLLEIAKSFSKIFFYSYNNTVVKNETSFQNRKTEILDINLTPSTSKDNNTKADDFIFFDDLKEKELSLEIHGNEIDEDEIYHEEKNYALEEEHQQRELENQGVAINQETYSCSTSISSNSSSSNSSSYLSDHNNKTNELGTSVESNNDEANKDFSKDFNHFENASITS